MMLDLFKKLNFSDKEIEIYLAILRGGKISPNDLSKLTKINRTTVYSVVNELIKKGIISQDFSQSRTYINALPPEDLMTIIKKEEKELERRKGVTEELIKEIKNSISNTKYSIPKIRFIGEDELDDYLYKQSPIWNESMLKNESLWTGFQDHTFAEYYQEWIDWYWNTSAPEQIKLQLLTNESKVEKQIQKLKYKNRLIKFYKKSHQFSASTWIVGDYMILLVTNQRPHYAIEILNPVLAENQREIFKGLWSMIK